MDEAPKTCGRTTVDLPEMGVRAAHRSRARVMLFAVVAALLWAVPPVPAKESENSMRFVVVTHPKNPANSASTAALTDLFLKRTTRWDNGEHVHPVDLKATSGVRKEFSERVLKRSVAAVRSYWQQRIFSGRALPPPEVDSEQAVVRYVSKHLGGIGYVGPETKLDGVKVIHVR